MLYNLIRNILFKFDPEKSHSLILNYLKFKTYFNKKHINSNLYSYKPVQCMGLYFKNIIGLAAGLDKNGEYIDSFAKMGFGFIEIGTVTPKPQYGNNTPRLFRVTPANAFINRMGFNNHGIKKIALNLKNTIFNGIIGVNIGKNQHTPIEKGILDYIYCMKKIYHLASYIAINISSPNTKKLKELQYGKLFEEFLIGIKHTQEKLSIIHKKYVPIAIKISPDLSKQEIVHIARNLIKYNIDAVIATNTTSDFSLIKGLKHSSEIGGLSGQPLNFKSTNIIKFLYKELNNKVAIIGVGGIDSYISAQEKICSGANLLQLYSSLIYKGPRVIKNIIQYL
ncbi:MAG: quinone-dependent dihydroorotate dehydrogenase [Buchnera aphidicola (Schlechtendalia peitan)]